MKSRMFIFGLVGMLMVLMASTSQAAITTLNASEDSKIDQHVNRGWLNYGSDGTAAIGRLHDAYTNPEVGPHVWFLMKWDLSSIASTDTVTDVALQLYNFTGSPTFSLDAYAIDTGAWDESTVTWNNFLGDDYKANANGFLSNNATYLGNMPHVLQSSGATILTSTTILTGVVQDWIDGDKTNLGLLVKYSGDAPASDCFNTFTTSEWGDSAYHPKLVINHVPEPATMSLLAIGGLALIKRRRV